MYTVSLAHRDMPNVINLRKRLKRSLLNMYRTGPRILMMSVDALYASRRHEGHNDRFSPSSAHERFASRHLNMAHFERKPGSSTDDSVQFERPTTVMVLPPWRDHDQHELIRRLVQWQANKTPPRLRS
jgi:hypothetical protein